MSLVASLIYHFVTIDSTYDNIVIEISTLYLNINSRIEHFQLHQSQNSWNLKPLVNGKELSEILNITPGPMIGKINGAQKEWQLENPEGDREECIDFLRSFYSQL